MSKSLLLPAILLLLPAPVYAQDPVQAKPIDGRAAPFDGRAAGADPFGGNAAVADPFAPANQKQANQPTKPKPAAKRAVAPGDAEDRIRAALDKLTTASFVELPLSDAIQQLSQQHDIPMLIDVRSLEELGLGADEPVSLSLRNVTLRSFLRLLLRELDLTFIIRDEIMMITSREAAENNLVLQTYPFPKTLVEKADTVITALTTTVMPDQWETQGGRCSVVAVENVLVVSASDAVHWGVVDFLEKLDDAFQRYAEKEKAKGTARP